MTSESEKRCWNTLNIKKRRNFAKATKIILYKKLLLHTLEMFSTAHFGKFLKLRLRRVTFLSLQHGNMVKSVRKPFKETFLGNMFLCKKENPKHIICIKSRKWWEQYLWTWRQSVVPNDAPRDFGLEVTFGTMVQIPVARQWGREVSPLDHMRQIPFVH